MQFGKVGEFFRRIKSGDVQQTGIRIESDIAIPVNSIVDAFPANKNTGPPTLTVAFEGEKYYLRYNGDPSNLNDPMTRYLFGQFCISFKGSPFEEAMKFSLTEWAKKNDNEDIHQIVKIIYGEHAPKKLVEPIKFHHFNFEK